MIGYVIVCHPKKMFKFRRFHAIRLGEKFCIIRDQAVSSSKVSVCVKKWKKAIFKISNAGYESPPSETSTQIPKIPHCKILIGLITKK